MENLQTLYSLDQGFSNAKARRILSHFTEGMDTSMSHSEISFSGSFRTLENSVVDTAHSLILFGKADRERRPSLFNSIWSWWFGS